MTKEQAGKPRRFVLASSSVALLLCAGACSGSKTGDKSSAGSISSHSAVSSIVMSSTPASPSPTSSSPQPRVVPESFADLEKLLLTRVPPGFRVQPDNLYDTGPSTLAKAIRDEGGTRAAARALRADGFVRGYQRLWAAQPASRQILVFLYQFKTAAGANAYYRRAVRQAAASAHADVKHFMIPGLPSRSTAASQRTDVGRSATADWVVGPLYAEVDCYAPMTFTPDQGKTRLDGA